MVTAYMSLAELSDRTGLSMRWLRREADARRIPCIRAGRRRMFNLDAVLKALAAREGEGKPRD